ncbi:hypothetical protein GIB67_028196 [Kingdonia uniflora]|uniref:Smr domain-containing protein n=1 Tax=Kingdonia uniflora TaxID=39325 RepID=A0A7J7KZ23_9MAGN|nr:hypothetical protein GIB67_028196 [Kingdonia uniflora]
MVIQLSLPLILNHHQPPLSSLKCALTKQGHRLLSTLHTASTPSAADRLIRKFIASSSKTVALNALFHLLTTDINHHSSLALPMYERISETSWFKWNPKLAASVIALLEKQGRFDEAQTLISESKRDLRFRGRDIALFYCDLIECHSKQGYKRGVYQTYACVKEVIRESELLESNVWSMVNQRVYECMINGLCTLGLPSDAEEMTEEMKVLGFKPSAFELRLIVLGYGRLGLFREMRGVLDEMEGFGYALDTICANMLLFSYGSNTELYQMVTWIQKMEKLNVPFSVRTYNSVLNSCPTIMLLLQDTKGLLLSLEELMEKLQGDELLLVQALGRSAVLFETLKWCSTEGKLDLHGMHLGSAYLIMLQWIEELRLRFASGSSDVPAEIIVICGLGKHSTLMGESPVKALISEMLRRLSSPMKLARKKGGSFVAKGKAVREWLL